MDKMKLTDEIDKELDVVLPSLINMRKRDLETLLGLIRKIKKA